RGRAPRRAGRPRDFNGAGGADRRRHPRGSAVPAAAEVQVRAATDVRAVSVSPAPGAAHPGGDRFLDRAGQPGLGAARAGRRVGGYRSGVAGVSAMQRVIFSADDFGLTESVNEAVELAHRKGALTSASLMVAGPAAADAVRRARALP